MSEESKKIERVEAWAVWQFCCPGCGEAGEIAGDVAELGAEIRATCEECGQPLLVEIPQD